MLTNISLFFKNTCVYVRALTRVHTFLGTRSEWSLSLHFTLFLFIKTLLFLKVSCKQHNSMMSFQLGLGNTICFMLFSATEPKTCLLKFYTFHLFGVEGWKFALKLLHKLSYSVREASQFLVLFTIALLAYGDAVIQTINTHLAQIYLFYNYSSNYLIQN